MMKEGIRYSSLLNINLPFTQAISSYNWSMNKISHVTNAPFAPLSHSVGKGISSLFSHFFSATDKRADDYRHQTIPYERFIYLSTALRLFKIKDNRELLLHLFTPSPFPPPEKLADNKNGTIIADFLAVTGVARVTPLAVNPSVFKQLVLVLKQGNALKEEDLNGSYTSTFAPEWVLLNFFASLIPANREMSSAITVAIKQVFWSGLCQLLPQAKWFCWLYDAANPLHWITQETDISQILRMAKMQRHLVGSKPTKTPVVIPMTDNQGLRFPAADAANPLARFSESWWNTPRATRIRRSIAIARTGNELQAPPANVTAPAPFKVNARDEANWQADWKTYVNTTNEVIDKFQGIFDFIGEEVKKAIKTCCDIDLDPHHTYYHKFRFASSSQYTVTGWEHVGPPEKSRTLTEKAMENFNADERIDDDTLNGSAGIYKDDNKAKFYNQTNEVAITPRKLKDVFINMDFANDFQQFQIDYWSKYSVGTRLMAKGKAISQAMKQRVDKKLSPEGLDLLDSAIFGNVLKNSNISMKTLKEEVSSRAGVTLTTFDINGYPASNIFMLRNREGKIIVYLPAEDGYYQEFDSEQDMKQWFVDQIKDPRKAEALARHFTLLNRQDGMLVTGVLSAMKKIQKGNWGSGAININPQTITVDAFTWLRDRMKDRIFSDAEVLTTSNHEVLKQQIIMNIEAAKSTVGTLFIVAPAFGAVAYLGMDIAEAGLDLDQAINGDTYAQRKKAIKSLFWDAAAILFDGIAALESIGVRENNGLRFGSNFVSDEVNIFKYPRNMEAAGEIKAETAAAANTRPILKDIKLTFWEKYFLLPSSRIAVIAGSLKKLYKRSPQRGEMLNAAMVKAVPTLQRALEVLNTPRGREILSLHLGYIERTEDFRAVVREFDTFTPEDLNIIRKYIKKDSATHYYTIDTTTTPIGKIADTLDKISQLNLDEMRSLLHEIKTLEGYDLGNRFNQYLEQLTVKDIADAKARIEAMLARAKWALANDKSFRYDIITDKTHQNIIAAWHQSDKCFSVTEVFMTLEPDAQLQTILHEYVHPSILVDGKPSPDLIYMLPRFGGSSAGFVKAKRDKSILFARGDFDTQYITGGGDHVKNGEFAKRFDPEHHSAVIAGLRVRENHALRRQVFWENADSFSLFVAETGGAISGTTNQDGTLNTPFRSV
ncbi:dermonecrotic toxin domain-containing protein [Pantoea cypripedii]|nr:DUF6543 domain-containing protein [Pantoea cypripedii]